MENHDCQLCHVWKGKPGSSTSAGLIPDRATCLGCHQGMATANFPSSGAMQFECSTCHKPHVQPLPTAADCLKCHAAIMRTGKHGVHIKDAGLTCKDCHKPHRWKITEAQAKVDCVQCHEYHPPSAFIAAEVLPAAAPAHIAARMP